MSSSTASAPPRSASSLGSLGTSFRRSTRKISFQAKELVQVLHEQHLGGKIERSKIEFPSSTQLQTILVTLIFSLLTCVLAVFVFGVYGIRAHNGLYDVGNLRGFLSDDDTANDDKEGLDWKASDSFPVAKLDDTDFLVFVGLFLWTTAIQAGLGLELLVWKSFLKEGWSQETEFKWRFAEFVFPLFALTSLGLALEKNFLAIPFLVLCIFKFGFPEVLTYMHSALYGTSSPWQRCADYINGIGTLLHHGAGSMVITMLLVGILPPDRHVIGPTLFPVMQHWFVLFKYYSLPLFFSVGARSGSVV